MQNLQTNPSVQNINSARFKNICLHCGNESHSLLYSCDCNNKKWMQQYRTIDISFDRQELQPRQFRSFQDYNFGNLDGMLQYEGLPFSGSSPDHLETVGLTPLYELRHLSQSYGSRLYLKNEGDNPSGCFKDRETMMCYFNSLKQGLKKAVIYSSGNAAASAASFAEHADHELITFVAGDTYPEKVDYIRDHGSDVVVIGDEQVNFEEGYRLFSELNAQSVFADRQFDNWSVRNPFRVQGDKTIALEIVKQLSPYKDVAQVPDYVLVPTANGSCLAGIWKGFKELKQAGVIPALPRLVSVGIEQSSPVNKAVRQRQTQQPVRCEPAGAANDGNGIGSIIRAEEGYDSIEAAKAVLESGGEAVDISSQEIQHTLEEFLEEEGFLAIKKGILPEPAALTSLAASRKLLSASEEDTVVSVITGHGLKALNVIHRMLDGRPILQKKVKQIAAVRENKMQKPVPHREGEVVQVEAELDAISQAFRSLQG